MANALISFLADFCAARKLDEKIVIVPSYQAGRQIGEALALAGNPWVNLHFVPLLSLAHDIAATEMVIRGLRQASAIRTTLIMDGIFRTLQDEGALGYFGKLRPSPGVIRAIGRAVIELRMAGITSSGLRPEHFIRPEKGREIILFLERYENALETEKLVDTPGLYALAASLAGDLRPEAACSDRGTHYLCPRDIALSLREKEFLEKAAGPNLILVPGDPVFGLERPRLYFDASSSAAAPEPTAPASDAERLPWLFKPEAAPPPLRDGTLSIFHAVGPTNECREVLRCVLETGLPMDRVEVLHPAGDVYPALFYTLTQKAGLPVTFAGGIPMAFSAPGRLFSGLLRWVGNGFMASEFCSLIESSDLVLEPKFPAGAPGLSATRTARFLRNAGIGWGRERYVPRLEALRDELRENAFGALEEDDVEKHARLLADSESVGRLAALLAGLLAEIPDLGAAPGSPGPGSAPSAGSVPAPAFVDFHALCRWAAAFVKRHARVAGLLDGQASAVLQSRLEEAADFEAPPVSRDDALEKIENLTAGLRIGASGPAPGCLHVADFGAGGWSGRPVTFVIGLEQAHFQGAGTQDPVLLDDERAKISPALRLTSDVLREDLFGTAGVLASLHGQVTLSFPSYDVIEAKPSFPASIVLQAWRLLQGDASLNYSELLSSLPKPKGMLPEGTAEALDDTDWWLAKIRPGSDVDAIDAVLRNFPDIASGTRAAAIRAGHKVSPYEGRIKVRPEDLHPSLNADIVMSASRIEKLAACPFGYFLEYVLGVRPPDEGKYDPSRWLDAAQRGRLVHDVLCRFMMKVRDAKEKVDPLRHAGLMKEVVDNSVARFRDEVPPPSEGIFEKEKKDILRTVEVFLNAEAGRSANVEPLLFEVSFGTGLKGGEGVEEPVEVDLGGGRSFRLKGRIDRIDRIEKGGYRVIDYKTGKIRDYDSLENARNCFGRGKILQHALYAVAAERILKAKGLDRAPRVVESGYSFPTRQGEGKEVFVRNLDRKRLREVLTLLFDIFQTGNFVANPNAECEFCDLAPACQGGAKAAKGKKNDNPGEFGIFEKLKDYS